MPANVSPNLSGARAAYERGEFGSWSPHGPLVTPQRPAVAAAPPPPAPLPPARIPGLPLGPFNFPTKLIFASPYQGQGSMEMDVIVSGTNPGKISIAQARHPQVVASADLEEGRGARLSLPIDYEVHPSCAMNVRKSATFLVSLGSARGPGIELHSLDVRGTTSVGIPVWRNGCVQREQRERGYRAKIVYEGSPFFSLADIATGAARATASGRAFQTDTRIDGISGCDSPSVRLNLKQ